MTVLGLPPLASGDLSLEFSMKVLSLPESMIRNSFPWNLGFLSRLSGLVRLGGDRLPVAGVILLGAVLRLFRLGEQSLWFDEVKSVGRASQSLDVIFTSYAQRLVHHVLLHWSLLLGDSEFWIRLHAAILGTAFLFVLYMSARELLGHRVAVVAALLAALSPFHIWYSQEARNYSDLMLLSLLSTYFLIRALRTSRGLYSVAYGIALLLTVASHRVGLSAVAFHMVAVAGVWLWRRPTIASLVPPVLAMSVATGYVAIGVWTRYGTAAEILNTQVGFPKPSTMLSLPYTLFAFSAGFSMGPSVSELHWDPTLSAVVPHLPMVLLLAAIFGGVTLLGLVRLAVAPAKLLFLAAYLVIPIAIAYLISEVSDFTYNVRYASVAVPAYYMILARGLVVGRKKTLGWALTAAVLVVFLTSLANYYFEPAYWKEDMRSAAQFIRSQEGSGDVIISVGNTLPFEYYYRGEQPIRSVGYPATRSEEGVHEMLEGALTNHSRAWLVLSRAWQSDPDGRVKPYLVQTYALVLAEGFPGVEVYLISGFNESSTAA